MNNAYYSEPLVLVDLETTGANPTSDRITEVGLVQIDERGARAWASLVNPGVSIPPFIQRLTGISDDMVANAPPFAEIAEDLLLKLEGRVFVAHNARFDYGFLKNEFKRLGLPFRARTLCTVKLSRKLYPGEFKHSLDTLVARHSLTIEGDRHRALTDAALLQQFLDVAMREHGAETVHTAIAELSRQPSYPPGLDPAVLDDLPEGPGVYLFYGDNDAPIYVGKSSNIRRRVLSHFSADHRAQKELQIAQAVRRIDWREAAGDFGALLLEAQLVKALRPVFNTRLRPSRELSALKLVDQGGALRPQTIPLEDVDFVAHDQDFIFGPFRAKRDITRLLEKLADGLNLCRVVLGLEGKAGAALTPCFASQLGKCKGVCCGREPLATHNARLLAALAKHKLAVWPYPGAIGLAEGPEWAPKLHVIDRWCYRGTLDDMSELPEMLANPLPAFDIDMFKLIQTELKRRGGKVVVF
ncbi:exonuclease domain-containing protein [Andreprevotia chitinilytica]|uniref:exonuclease domain-containing protein n=1 Tax=Andreprevotia chitinilytica TaxID=396808 RepID=UPI0005509844|nr:exonuclease domain-containing protein [Andreprevotia chitinilytica]